MGRQVVKNAKTTPRKKMGKTRKRHPNFSWCLVVINNVPEARTLDVRLSGLGVAGEIAGEQSHGQARWDPLKTFAPESARRFKSAVPAMSVTTFAGRLEMELRWDWRYL
jgi:hypothetical protein